jgi:hypothetical protein
MFRLLLVSFLLASICSSAEIKYLEFSKVHSSKTKKEIEKILKYNDSLYGINAYFIQCDSTFVKNDFKYIRNGLPGIDTSLIFISINPFDIKYVVNNTSYFYESLSDSQYKILSDVKNITDELWLQFYIFKLNNYHKVSESKIDYGVSGRLHNVYFAGIVLYYTFTLYLGISFFIHQFKFFVLRKKIKKDYQDVIDDFYLFKIQKIFYPHFFKFINRPFYKRWWNYPENINLIINDLYYIRSLVEIVKQRQKFNENYERYSKFISRVQSYLDKYVDKDNQVREFLSLYIDELEILRKFHKNIFERAEWGLGRKLDEIKKCTEHLKRYKTKIDNWMTNDVQLR